MTLLAFESLLKQAIGLDAASIGSSAVQRAVDARAAVCGIRDDQTYLERLRSSPDELRALVETVVVSETWFFRHPEAFTALARIARDRRRAASGPLRVLSIPCAAGEEPYTVAMTLLDAGLLPGQFRINGMDVSDRVIDHARAAVYGKNSFRGNNLAFRDHYFRPEAAGYRLTEPVRSCVDFARGNLLAPDFERDKLYDVVFCRNLLIYFDAATQEVALSALNRLVDTDGHIFVGPSEASLLLGRGFEPLNTPMAFAFRRRTKPPTPAAATARWPGARPDRKIMPLRYLLRRPAPSAGEPHRAAQSWLPPETSLARGAAPGRPGAPRRGSAALRGSPAPLDPRPTFSTLLGVIRDATGNAVEAADLYRKALYLDPLHHEALAHWALLLETEGDMAGAKAMNERMGRLNRRKGA